MPWSLIRRRSAGHRACRSPGWRRDEQLATHGHVDHVGVRSEGEAGKHRGADRDVLFCCNMSSKARAPSASWTLTGSRYRWLEDGDQVQVGEADVRGPASSGAFAGSVRILQFDAASGDRRRRAVRGLGRPDQSPREAISGNCSNRSETRFCPWEMTSRSSADMGRPARSARKEQPIRSFNRRKAVMDHFISEP